MFARRGLAQASVDEVAADAGFTKGAVYANFGSKEELFLEMLDAELRPAAGGHGARDVDRRAAGGSRRAPPAATSWTSWAATRTGSACSSRRRCTRRATRRSGSSSSAHYATMRERMADLLRARSEAGGFDPGVPFDQLATMILAMANGVGFERLVDAGGGARRPVLHHVGDVRPAARRRARVRPARPDRRPRTVPCAPAAR